MALEVEDGSGKTNAESYISVSDADAYHTAFGNATWTGAGPLKEAALRRATRYIDGRYGGRFTGYKAQRQQALQWPRLDALDQSNYLLPANEVPTKLKQAAAEAALLELVTPGTLTPRLERGGQVSAKTVQAGPVSSSTTFASGAPTRATVTVIDDLLAPLISLSLGGQLERA